MPGETGDRQALKEGSEESGERQAAEILWEGMNVGGEHNPGKLITGKAVLEGEVFPLSGPSLSIMAPSKVAAVLAQSLGYSCFYWKVGVELSSVSGSSASVSLIRENYYQAFVPLLRLLKRMRLPAGERWGVSRTDVLAENTIPAFGRGGNAVSLPGQHVRQRF